jgi:hypothetical protein
MLKLQNSFQVLQLHHLRQIALLRIHAQKHQGININVPVGAAVIETTGKTHKIFYDEKGHQHHTPIGHACHLFLRKGNYYMRKGKIEELSFPLPFIIFPSPLAESQRDE